MNKAALDTQQIEIVGRNLLVSLFISDGIEVAMPMRDRGIDVIAFLDLPEKGSFKAVPVQLKAFSQRGFGVYKKYEKFPDMLIAYLWFANEPLKAELYVLTYEQAVGIADHLGWTKTISWTSNGSYITSKPSKELVGALEPYKYSPGKLADLIRN
jgi:hypothetical protein